MPIGIWNGSFGCRLPDMQIRGETGTQRLIGYVIDIEDGIAKVSLDVTEAHGNRHGVLHGGFISLLLDNVMGVTSSLTEHPDGLVPFMTVALNTQFHAPAYVGQRVTGTGRVVNGGRSLLFCQGELTSEDGKLIATATGIFKRVPQGGATP